MGTDLRGRIEQNSIPEPNSGCWLWLLSVNGRRTAGHGYIRISHRTRMAHRVAWEAFRGPVPSEMNVLHRCDVASCVNPDHLFLGTQADNMRDMAQKGRARSGIVRLTAEQAREIRTAYLIGSERVKDLSRRFGVRREHIRDIGLGLAWRSA